MTESAEAGNGGPPERELRLALVCYGGVSLAVYMHGITREIHHLVRASRDYQQGREARGDDTQAIYRDLLSEIGKQVNLRVLVDVIAGASAGGINGIMLARALAYDLPLERHRRLWLELADVGELLDPDARPGRWSKLYMRPLFWLAGYLQRRRARRLGTAPEDPAVLRNLSLFMRSRWFEPPFSGRRMSEMMLDALRDLGERDTHPDSLLPSGIPLELFVTATDFWGHAQRIQLHDPPEVNEQEHRLILHFHHWRSVTGELQSQLTTEHVPSLAFAARATSSFPGAFPPARLAEIDALLADRELVWPGRDNFVSTQFKGLRSAGEDPEEGAFIDGSVLMNKPVSVALEAVQRHVAHREIDRRLVYLEPNPEVRRSYPREVPGFFKTLKGSVSDIPRHQPIRDDLEWIARFNQEVRLHQQVVNAIRPRTMQMMTEMLGDRLDPRPSIDELADWRRRANRQAAIDAGYTYEGYARLKVLQRLDDLGHLLGDSLPAQGLMECQAVVQAWAQAQAIRPLGSATAGARDGNKTPWVRFLLQFDVRHRLRRVLLLIRRCNELYVGSKEVRDADGRQWLDGLKEDLYELAERLRQRTDWLDLDVPLPATLAAEPVGEWLDGVASWLDLPGEDRVLNRTLSEWAWRCLDEKLVRDILTAYLGYAFYDVLTFPMAHSRDLDALEEIKVDRIAVDDANTLREGSAKDILKGVEFGNFGAFFSRRFRENDYLWGRLTAAERLVDIVGSAVPEAVAAGLDLADYKRRLFLAILAAEAPHLTEIQDEIDDLQVRAAAL